MGGATTGAEMCRFRTKSLSSPAPGGSPNARATVSDLLKIGHDVFNRFTAGRDMPLWYHRSRSEIFERGRASMAAMRAAEDRQMELLLGVMA